MLIKAVASAIAQQNGSPCLYTILCPTQAITTAVVCQIFESYLRRHVTVCMYVCTVFAQSDAALD